MEGTFIDILPTHCQPRRTIQPKPVILLNIVVSMSEVVVFFRPGQTHVGHFGHWGMESMEHEDRKLLKTKRKGPNDSRANAGELFGWFTEVL